MSQRHTFAVDAGASGTRLDVYLARQLRPLSRVRVQALIASGRVTVDGQTCKPADPVLRGQRVDIEIPPAVPSTLRPEPLPLDIVYEDEALLVINKPAGLVVHPGAGRPGGTLANAILAQVPDLQGIGGVLRPGIVHRLDKDTSGLLVVAKTARALANLQTQVAARTASRRYLALVHGSLTQETGTIRAPIGRHPYRRTHMAVVAKGREAITHYRVVERFAKYTLLEASLVTGRTHQIRVHFAHQEHPVVGDATYGPRKDALGLTRQALHAYRLQFRHPTTETDLVFEAPLPPDIAAVVARLRADKGSAGVSRMSRKKL